MNTARAIFLAVIVSVLVLAITFLAVVIPLWHLPWGLWFIVVFFMLVIVSLREG